MRKTFAISCFLAFALSGCAGPTQVLVGQGFAGDRVVRYTIEPTGQSTDETGQLFHLRARLCNQQVNGEDANCKDNLLLENVQPRSIY